LKTKDQSEIGTNVGNFEYLYYAEVKRLGNKSHLLVNDGQIRKTCTK